MVKLGVECLPPYRRSSVPLRTPYKGMTTGERSKGKFDCRNRRHLLRPAWCFPCRLPRVPAASSVLFFTVKHPGRPSPGIPVCNVPLQAMILRSKSDVWIIIYLWYISPCLVSVYLAFLGYFDFILACFFGSDWYIFSITLFRAHQGPEIQ